MITIYDTSTGSLNLGDQIIMDAVLSEIQSIFPQEFFQYFPTHYSLTNTTLKKAWNNPLGFVAGTNLLKDNWEFDADKNQWAISLYNVYKMNPAILLGVGWNSYSQEKITKKAIFFYNKALHKSYKHSVRDSYTLKKLNECGLYNIINTGCPTVWKLTKDHLSEIPNVKSNKVVFTLTDYSQNIEHDVFFIECLIKNYDEIFFWPQGSGDLDYFLSIKNKLSNNAIKVLRFSLSDYNNLLDENIIDFIGTRLHAGIRALQKKSRTIIIGIDNRAIEMKKDINLPVIERDNLDSLELLIKSKWHPQINLPHNNIKQWKEQFH